MPKNDNNRAKDSDQAPRSISPAATLQQERIITIFGEVDKVIAQRTNERLLAFNFIEPEKPITIFISSPGGHVDSGVAIFDMIRFVQPKVRVVGVGWVGSIATHIFLAPPKAERFCLAGTRFLIHQPSTAFTGAASDIEIQAKEILRIRESINSTIAEQTERSLEQVEEDTHRDLWMTADESVEYGLVGQIIQRIQDLP